jgi:predicted metal-dependent peptidase
MNNVFDLLAAGRLISTRKAPYLGAMIKALVPTEMRGLGTVGVTKTLLFLYDPEWVVTLQPEEVGGLYWHEVMHPTLNHFERRGDRDPYLWNVAGDVFINDHGRAAGFKFPKGGLYSETFGWPKELSAEEYYALALKMAQQQKQQCQHGQPQQGQQGSGQGQGAGGGQPGDQQSNDSNPVKDKVDEVQRPPNSWKSGACGSGAGNPMKDEPSDAAQAEAGGRSESDVQQTRMRVAEAVKQHAQSKGRGNMPCGLDRWADAMIAPAVIPWQTKLQRGLRRALSYRAGAVDYSFSRPSRRQGALGYGPGCAVLPALVRPVLKVMFWLDTSGSMSQGQLEAGLAEACGVLKAVGAEIMFGACDAAVHATGKVQSPRELAKLVKGGGGSSFVPAFEHMARMRDRPNIAIFATDGDIGVPPVAPAGITVIWLLIGASHAPTTAYGEVIDVGDP